MIKLANKYSLKLVGTGTTLRVSVGGCRPEEFCKGGVTCAAPEKKKSEMDMVEKHQDQLSTTF